MKQTLVAAAVSFALGAAVSAGFVQRARPAGLAGQEASSVAELAAKLSEMDVKEAERELREALKRNPDDAEAIKRFVTRVRGAGDRKSSRPPFGSL